MLVALGMGALLSSGSLVGLAERQPLGTQRDVVLGTAEVVDRLAHFLSLNRPADRLAVALDHEEQVYDVEALIARARTTTTTVAAGEPSVADDDKSVASPTGGAASDDPDPDQPLDADDSGPGTDDATTPPTAEDCSPVDGLQPDLLGDSTATGGSTGDTDAGDGTRDADPDEPTTGSGADEPAAGSTERDDSAEDTNPDEPITGSDPDPTDASTGTGGPADLGDVDEDTDPTGESTSEGSDDPAEPIESDSTDDSEPTRSTGTTGSTDGDDPTQRAGDADPEDSAENADPGGSGSDDDATEPADRVECPPGYVPADHTTATTDPTTTSTPTSTSTSTTAPVTTTTTTVDFDAPRVPEQDQPLRLYVGGDSISRDLGEGLARLTAADLVTIDVDPRPATGLSRPDFFDWAQHLAGLLTESGADVIVVLFGANDFQNVEHEGKILDRFTDEWLDLYRERVGRIMALVSQPDVQTVWVGQPPVRESRLSGGLARLNEVYAEQAEQHPQITFVDTWELFSNDEGGYADEIDGVRVRREDGVHLTVAGGNRLARAVWDVIAPAWGLD